MANLNDTNGEGDDEDRIKSGWKARKGDQFQFKCARAGDDLMVQFECDLCVFSKLFKRLPNTGQDTSKDAFAMACIRRVTLDAFWSRATSTVRSNAYLMRTLIKSADDNFGLLDGAVEDPGPLPAGKDHCGYRVAMHANGCSFIGRRPICRFTQTMGHHPANSFGILEPVQILGQMQCHRAHFDGQQGSQCSKDDPSSVQLFMVPTLYGGMPKANVSGLAPESGNKH